MPLLKPPPQIDFDPRNPEHVRAVWSIETRGVRTGNLTFNFPPPYTSGISYAKHLIFQEWCKLVGVAEEGQASCDDTIGGGPVTIGVKSKPLQETISRTLSPGSVLTH